jgi:predicted metalloprotease
MRWRGKRQSNNIDDRRHMRASGLGGAGAGMLRLLPMAFRFLGFKGTAVVAVGLLAYGLFTGNLGGMLGLQQGPAATGSSAPLQQTAEEKELVQFVSVVLADTEETWHTIFKSTGKTYKEPKLVLFRGAVQSACGMGQAAMGPFYCPGDQQVYIDLEFFSELKNRFKAPGDFAQAYVIAHEVGHHLQTLLGISSKVQKAKSKLSEVEANKLSVRQELQADCLAGVWANHANTKRQLLEHGDVEEGLRAATAIGDDTLQKQARGHVTPDSFTHGSSAQRVKWFKIGLAKGDMNACDTFNNFDAKAPADTHISTRMSSATVASAASNSADAIKLAFRNKQSDKQIAGAGTVRRTLADDNEGSRHQKFILELDNGHSILVSHNIDLAPRIDGLKKGDRVEFYGEYEWSEKGGVIHWTHDDPRGRHADGWLKHNGSLYQ